MIEIHKNREPRDLIQYRKLPFSSFDGMPRGLKEKILKSLMREQGYLCAYCMRRIPQKKGDPKVSIEHWAAQSENDATLSLDYHNLLAVCSGNRGCGSQKNLTCDARKGKESITVNPLVPSTLIHIDYGKDGKIYAKDVEVKKDLQENLNLNAPFLVQNRKSALETMIRKVKREHPHGEIKNYCLHLLKHYQNQEKKTPYVGILMDWLQKHSR